MGYDVSVISDGIGDRDIPGASAKQLVDVSSSSPSPLRLRFFFLRTNWEEAVDHRKDHPGRAGRCLSDGYS